MSIPKEMLINCNNLYLLHHRNDQMHVNSNHPLKLLALAKFFSITNSSQLWCFMFRLTLQLNLTWHLNGPYSHGFYWLLHVTRKLLMCHFTHNHQNNTPVHRSNTSKFSKCETHHKQYKTLKICLTQTLLQCFV